MRPTAAIPHAAPARPSPRSATSPGCSASRPPRSSARTSCTTPTPCAASCRPRASSAARPCSRSAPDSGSLTSGCSRPAPRHRRRDRRAARRAAAAHGARRCSPARRSRSWPPMRCASPSCRATRAARREPAYNVSVPVLLHLLEHVPSLRSRASSWCRPRSAPARGRPRIEGVRRPERQGRLVRAMAHRRPGVAHGVLAGAERGLGARRLRARRRHPPGTEAERRATFALVDAAFQQRRKMLRQSLSGALGGSAAVSDSDARAGGRRPAVARRAARVDDFLADRARRSHPGRRVAGTLPGPRPCREYRGGMGRGDGSIGSSGDAAGERSVRDATGRSREEWFEILDGRRLGLAGVARWPRGSWSTGWCIRGGRST